MIDLVDLASQFFSQISLINFNDVISRYPKYFLNTRSHLSNYYTLIIYSGARESGCLISVFALLFFLIYFSSYSGDISILKRGE